MHVYIYIYSNIHTLENVGSRNLGTSLCPEGNSPLNNKNRLGANL